VSGLKPIHLGYSAAEPVAWDPEPEGLAEHSFRRFILHRRRDPTGVSGVGMVAEGVQFSDGRCVVRWRTSTAPSSTAVHDSIGAVKAIHGHNGDTIVVWLDEAAP